MEKYCKYLVINKIEYLHAEAQGGEEETQYGYEHTTAYGFIANISCPEYHYYFTDHLGSVRVVTDAQGNVEQVNNYYPYGGLMASSSSIATPSSSYPANQPYRYNGKELDRKNNLDWMDYGAMKLL